MLPVPEVVVVRLVDKGIAELIFALVMFERFIDAEGTAEKFIGGREKLETTATELGAGSMEENEGNGAV